MRYAGIKYNDIVDGDGVCVSLWMQGCPHRCKGCHNPETWSFDGGIEIPRWKLTSDIIEAIKKNFQILKFIYGLDIYLKK